MINTIRSNKQPINKNATFQKKSQPFIKITLPELPTTIIVNHNVNEIVPQNIIINQVQEKLQSNDFELLQFIDFDKMLDIKQSKNINVYELKDLKNLAKKINININHVNKKSLIEKIKEEYKNQFGDNINLVADIKLNKDLDLKTITKLFDKYHIISYKNDLLNQIEKIIISKHEILASIIKLLENQWLDKSVK